MKRWQLLFAVVLLAIFTIGCGQQANVAGPDQSSAVLTKGNPGPHVALVGELVCIGPDDWAKYCRLHDLYGADFIHYPKSEFPEYWYEQYTAPAGVVCQSKGVFEQFGDSIVQISYNDCRGLDTLTYERIISIGAGLTGLTPDRFEYWMKHFKTANAVYDDRWFFQNELGYTRNDAPGFVFWDGKKHTWMSPASPIEALIAIHDNW